MKKGVACICLSAFGFALMSMFVRLADGFGDPLPATQKAFFRNLMAIGIALAAFLRVRRTALATLKDAGWGGWSDLVLRAFFGTMGIFANFYAISHIPLGDAMALNKTAPFFTLVGCLLLMGERIRPVQALCVLGAFAGALLVIRPGFAGGVSVAAGIGLFSGICAGLAYAYLHRLGRRGMNAAFIIFFFSCFSCLASLPFLVFDYHPMTGGQVLALLGAGAGAALGQFGITWAYRFAEPRQVAVYDYSGILFAVALGYLVFGQVPDVLSLTGMAIIVAVGIWVRRLS